MPYFSARSLSLLCHYCPRLQDGRQIHFLSSATIEQTPRQVGLDFEDVSFSTRDGVRLNGWFIPHREARSTWLVSRQRRQHQPRVENIKLPCTTR